MLSIDKISIIWQKMKQNILNVGCGTIFESKYSSIHRSHMNKFFLVPSNYKKRRQKLSTWLNLGLINLKNVDTIFKRLQWERRISASYSQYSWDEILLRCNLNENVHLFEQLIPISVICENFRKIPKLILNSILSSLQRKRCDKNFFITKLKIEDKNKGNGECNCRTANSRWTGRLCSTHINALSQQNILSK